MEERGKPRWAAKSPIGGHSRGRDTILGLRFKLRGVRLAAAELLVLAGSTMYWIRADPSDLRREKHSIF